ncbi:crocetin glucosyltransferase 2-like [Phoenix dactylifera]|uniref:Glycosyltransferase n=1 Tax=Phoenix dactylifera TaxID=42345 RepID=A0A8B7BYW2_PHODC|nr:crocetin glucosyltransferase 2-like [Phoenix dactylifera]
MENGSHQPHVLVLPYPSQGHINPMLQFAKRLSSRGLLATLATTRFVLSTTRPEPGPVALATISDGFDQGGFASADSIEAYLDRVESVGSATLDELIRSERAAGRPVRALVYDSFFPWAREVGERRGLATAAFFTQPCGVNIVYGHVNERRLGIPVTEPVSLPGLPRLEPDDMPSFVSQADAGLFASYLKLVLEQYKNLDKADAVFVNSFYELEPEEAGYMASAWRAKTMGPTVPSSYLDNRLPSDSHYGFDLYTPSVDLCMQWLDSLPSNSVVYVSFGSMTPLGPEQMAELAFGLLGSGKRFLWVVRSSEASKLPENFAEDLSPERGLVVSWSPQMAVLSHEAVGCFLTHCGWNSTMEGISLGVPMVGVPQWTDQPTNAKYVEDVWRVGVRARAGERGLVGREEVERCVRVVMEGERSEEIRRNSSKWRELAKKAVAEGGSSDRNILEFVAKYCSK